jgi:hypothetical protein
VFALGFMPIYQVVAPAIGFSTEYTNIVTRLWTSPVYYLCLIVLPVLCLVRDFAWKSYVTVDIAPLFRSTDLFFSVFPQVQAPLPTRAAAHCGRSPKI